MRIDKTVRNAIDIRTWSGQNLFKRTGSVSTSQDFSQVDLQPREYYVGQLYGAIRTRANRVADLAKDHTKTRLFDDPEAEIDDVHPYLTLINESPSFANTYFWKALSTFLDLTGTAYVYVLRNANKSNTVKGKALEFKIVNPFNLTKVVKGSDVGKYRYIETGPGGVWREIPEEQLIVIHTLNPFSLSDGYAMIDAAKDDQFSIQQARSYTRGAIKNNVGQRGLLAPEVVLGNEDFANFETAVKDKGTDGKFLTTNSPVKYTDMQIDLDKLALDKINTISVETLVMVTGASKTLLGVEQSQISQEQAKVQRELFAENHAIPQLTDILDALNQDYKNSYPADYETNKLEMYVDSPLKVDKDSELKDAQIEKQKADTAAVLINAGYEPDSVSKYLDLDDELTFEERQKPENRKVKITMPGGEETDVDDAEEVQSFNAFSPGLDVVVRSHESSLANQIQNIEGQILQAVIPKLSDKFKNDLSKEEAQSISKTDKDRIEHDLALALASFGTAMVTLFAGQTMSRRFAEFSLPAEFTMNEAVNKTIKQRAKKSANSHVETFIKNAFSEARKAGMEGLGRDAIVSRLTGMFPEMSRKNATRIARTESYRAVNLAQYEADKQFIAQHELQPRAYKKWFVQSSNPCFYCQEMAKRPPVPFAENFLDVGDSVKAEFEKDGATVTREFVSEYDSVESGSLHPNCSCTYELIIRRG